MSTNPYDPVTTTDTTTLSDDDWGLSLPGVRYKNYYDGNSRCKGLCRVLQERPKISALVFLIILGVVLLIVIVAVSTGGKSKRHPTGEEPKWKAQTEGLEFYPIPEDKSIVIAFNVNDMGLGNHNPLIDMMNNITSEYKSTDQIKEEIYMDCTANDTSPNKTCRLFDTRFGDDCTKQESFGYEHAMPCVLIQLNLPDGVMIKPIDPASPLWDEAKLIVDSNNDPSYVPLICQGKTEADRKAIGVKGLGGDAIQYYPKDGFPSFFYRPRDHSLPFIKPAVMVRLTSVHDEHLVHFSCTAWGQLFKYNGSIEDHGLLTTEFAMYIHHKAK